MALRDIRGSIPQTDLTNPNKFPEVEYRRYPLAPTGADGKHYLDEVGKIILLQSREDEEAFKAEHPDMREVLDAVDKDDELARLREENAKLRAQNEAPPDEGDKDPAKDEGKDGGASALLQQSKAADKGKLKLGAKLD